MEHNDAFNLLLLQSINICFITYTYTNTHMHKYRKPCLMEWLTLFLAHAGSFQPTSRNNMGWPYPLYHTGEDPMILEEMCQRKHTAIQILLSCASFLESEESSRISGNLQIIILFFWGLQTTAANYIRPWMQPEADGISCRVKSSQYCNPGVTDRVQTPGIINL